MKLWQLKSKIRKFGNRIRWPLVTRARFEMMQENYDNELVHYERTISDLRTFLSSARQQLDAQDKTLWSLKTQLEQSQKNDHRNPKTGQYEKAISDSVSAGVIGKD